MADYDDELNLGVKIDSTQLFNEYQDMLKQLSAETQKQIQGTIDSLKGAAAKAWGPLPYDIMHDTGKGNRFATYAFLPSLMRDLQASGVQQGSSEYESALMNAVYRSSISDPMQRHYRMVAEGNWQQASLTAPETALGKAIETNYRLMEQSWARGFTKSITPLTDADLKGYKKAELKDMVEEYGLTPLGKKKADLIQTLVQGTQTPRAFIDFAGMREFAVDKGIGRWADPEGEHTAENFEFIEKELDKIDEKADKSKKTFEGWGSALKSALGVLTAIHGLRSVEKAFEIAYKASEAGVTAGAATLPRTRALINMSSTDVLETQVAGQSVSLGKDAVYNEILKMGTSIQQYKTRGKGDALPASLLGVFDTLIDAENPYASYKTALQSIYNDLKGAEPEERTRTLAWMQEAGLGAGATIIGAFLSNPDFASKYGNIESLFTLLDNPYKGSFDVSETILPEIAKLNASLKQSYTELYNDWEASFGLRFKGWWDDFLKTSLIPGFKALIYPTTPEGKEWKSFDKDWNAALARAKHNKQNTGYIVVGASKEAIMLNDVQSWDKLKLDKSLFESDIYSEVKQLTAYKPKTGLAGGQARAFLSALETAANPGAYVEGKEDNVFQSRAELALDFLKTTGLHKTLGDVYTTDSDEAIIRVIQEYLAEGDKAILETFLTNSYTQSAEWKELLSVVKEYKEFLQKTPEAVSEIHIRLFDQYGSEIQAKVDRIINKE